MRQTNGPLQHFYYRCTYKTKNQLITTTDIHIPSESKQFALCISAIKCVYLLYVNIDFR